MKHVLTSLLAAAFLAASSPVLAQAAKEPPKTAEQKKAEELKKAAEAKAAEEKKAADEKKAAEEKKTDESKTAATKPAKKKKEGC